MRCNFLVWSVLLMLYAIIANLIIHCIIRHFKETRKDNEAKGMGERIFFLGFFELLVTLFLLFWVILNSLQFG